MEKKRGRPKKVEEKRGRGRPFGSTKKRPPGRPKKGEEPKKKKPVVMPKLPVREIKDFDPKDVSSELTRHKIQKADVLPEDVPEYIRTDVKIVQSKVPGSFKPGESGNPKGRPKNVVNRSSVVLQWLKVEVTQKNPLTGLQEKLTVLDLVTLSLINQAMKGNVQAWKELMDSAYGKAVQPVQLDIDNNGQPGKRQKVIKFVKK